jgi:hypothetical protein
VIDDTLKERGRTHGDFTETAHVAQELKSLLYAAQSTHNGARTPAMSEALDMICTKLARIVCGDPNEPDHWRDIAGYARLVELVCAGADGRLLGGAPVQAGDLVPPAGISVAYAPRSPDDREPWAGERADRELGIGRCARAGTREGVIAQLEGMLK